MNAQTESRSATELISSWGVNFQSKITLTSLSGMQSIAAIRDNPVCPGTFSTAHWEKSDPNTSSCMVVNCNSMVYFSTPCLFIDPDQDETQHVGFCWSLYAWRVRHVYVNSIRIARSQITRRAGKFVNILCGRKSCGICSILWVLYSNCVSSSLLLLLLFWSQLCNCTIVKVKLTRYNHSRTHKKVTQHLRDIFAESIGPFCVTLPPKGFIFSRKLISFAELKASQFRRERQPRFVRE